MHTELRMRFLLSRHRMRTLHQRILIKATVAHNTSLHGRRSFAHTRTPTEHYHARIKDTSVINILSFPCHGCVCVPRATCNVFNTDATDVNRRVGYVVGVLVSMKTRFLSAFKMRMTVPTFVVQQQRVNVGHANNRGRAFFC